MQTLVVFAPGDAQDEGPHTLSSSCCGPEDLPPSSGLDAWKPGRQLKSPATPSPLPQEPFYYF